MKLAVLLPGLAFATAVLGAGEPRNLAQLKGEIRAYVQSGEYDRTIAAVAADAERWLVERAARRAPGERLAVVLDLDETLLSNWPFMAAEDLGGSDTRWDQWLAEGRAPAIEPVRAVYRAARRLAIEVYFITGRREHLRSVTERNLRAIDCADHAALIMKPEKWRGLTAAYKTAERARLAAQGCVIIANLGDQDSDLVGGHAERTYKLPGPFYLSE